MLRSEAMNQIKRDLPARYLIPAKYKTFICPICGSGSGKDGTGISSKDNIHFTCWAGQCFSNADIIDIIGIERGLTDFNDKLKAACDEAGIDYDSLENDSNIDRARRDFTSVEAAADPVKKEDTPTDRTDYTAFFCECAKRLKETDYLKSRGISDRTAASFLIGYCPDWQSPAALKKGYNPPKTPRLIIPTSRYSYLARDTRAELDETAKKYAKQKEGDTQLFNVKALENMPAAAFITEGEIDALSIIEIGYRALALGSIGNIDRLITYLKSHKPDKPLLVAMDNDPNGKGQAAAASLMDKLRAADIEAYKVDILGDYKDPNDALVGDREAFTNRVVEALRAAEIEADRQRQEYLSTSTANYLEDFKNGIADSVNTPYIPTGIFELDELLDRGLYGGSFYILGAISSLGKTTLALQIADNMAKQGQDVLIISMEMSRTELMAKSISRETALIAREKPYNNIDLAKSTRGITVFNFYKTYSEDERQIIDEALESYGSYAKHIYISEGIGDITAADIKGLVDKHISFTGNRPVVIVDYLQILAPMNERTSDKQNTDRAVLELKRLCRDCKVALLAISSFNRENYNNAVNMTAFKESGAIEYGSDVLLGLQLEGAGQDGFNSEAAIAQTPRKVEVKILKNRNGKRTSEPARLLYYPAFNLFRGNAEPKESRPVISKRGRKREELEAIYTEAKNRYYGGSDDKVTVNDMADVCDRTTKYIRDLITEYGHGRYTLKKNGVVSEWVELDEDTQAPF